MNPSFQTGAPSKQTLPKLLLSQIENDYFSRLFRVADQSGAGRIDGRSAVNFLKTSNLPLETLKLVWTLCTPNQENFLDAERFYGAVKFIAMSQNGKALSVLALNEKCPLPRFQGIDVPQESVADEWEINDSDKKVYKEAFKKLSGDKGFLNGLEAKELLQRTQFPVPTLKKLWGLCDPNRSGTMKEGQFMVAMQIIAKVRGKGIEVPEILPPSLQRVIEGSGDIEQLPVQESVQPAQISSKQLKPLYKEPPKSVKFKDPDQNFEEPVPVYSKPKDLKEEKPRVSPDKKRQETNKYIEENADFVYELLEDKQELLKRQDDMLRSIIDMLDLDSNELDLFRQKNKQLESKIKEQEENFKKMQAEFTRHKTKFEENLKKQKDDYRAAQQENTYLKEKTKSIPEKPVQTHVYEKKTESYPETQKVQEKPKVQFSLPDAPRNVQEPQRAAFNNPRGFETAQPQINPISLEVRAQTSTNPFDFDESPIKNAQKNQFGLNLETPGGFKKPQSPQNRPKSPEFSQTGRRSDISQPFTIPQSPKSEPQTQPFGFGPENTKAETKPKKFDPFAFGGASKTPEASKIDNKSYEAPGFTINKAADPFQLASGVVQAGASRDFGSSLNLENKPQAFSFNMPSQDNSKKVEFSQFTQPSQPSFDIKPENIQFDPQFDKFNTQGFDFKNPGTFSTDFFKKDSKPKTSELDFDFD